MVDRLVTAAAVAAVRRGRLVTGPRTVAAGAGRGRPGTVLLLVFHPPVLEPDLDLFLGQPQTVGDLDAPETRQVHVVGEFPFQFQQLVAGERRPDPFRASRIRVAALRVVALALRCCGAGPSCGR